MATQFQTQSVRNFLRGRKDITPLSESLPISMPQSTVAVAEPGSGFLGLLKTIGQEVARNIGSAGVTIVRALKGETIKPKEDFTQFRVEDAPPIMQGILKSIFRDESIKSIEQRIVEAEPKVKVWGEALAKSTNPIFSGIGSIAKDNPTALAFAGIMGSVGIDLTPFGGSSKNVFKAMVSAKNADEAIALLGKMGVADDLARTFADDVVKVAKVEDAKKLFNSIANAQRTTRVSRPVAEAVPEIIPRVIRPVVEAVIKEIKPKLDKSAKKFLEIIEKRGAGEVDSVDSVVKLADRIRILEGGTDIRSEHLAEAFSYRGSKQRFIKNIIDGFASRFGDTPTQKQLEEFITSPNVRRAEQVFGEEISESLERALNKKLSIKTKIVSEVIPKVARPAAEAAEAAIPKSLEPLAQEVKRMKIVPKEQVIKEFDSVGLATIATRSDGVRLTMKDEGDFIKIGMDTGELVDTELAKQFPEMIFATKEEAFEALRPVFERKQLGAVRGVKEVGAPPIKPPIPPTAPIAPIEEAGNTIQKLIKAIDDAVPLRADQKKLYQEELARRTARVAQAGAKVEGEVGFFAQLGALKGELPKKSFEAIRNQFSQKEIDLLFNTIEQTKTLLPLEKVGTKEGLRKLFEGIVPTPSEIQKLREVFPKELIDSLLARRPLLQRITELAGEIINIPRTAMASVDLSAPFRQGVFMIGRPKRFLSAFKDMFRFAVSEKAYQGLIEGIKARPTYLKMKQGGLALTEIGGPLLKREEVFMGNMIEKVPIYGRLIRASNRAYTGFLNKLRADIFDDILTKAKTLGRDIDAPLLESMADFINAGTGRGKFGLKETGILPKSMEKAAPVMNAAFFSPRLMASRLNLLNPYFYIQLDPLVRKEAMKTLFADAGIFASIYGLWKLNGGEVGLDPRSADFGKIKIGNTRFDPLGGFQQYIKLAAQLVTGEIISSTTGRTITLGEGFKPLTRKEIVLRFFENKTSPIASFIIGLMTGQTAVGKDVDIPTEVVNRFIPMVVQDLYDISQEEGAEGLLYGLPAIFGVGVQTYGKQELAEGVSRIGEPTTQIRPVPELGEKIRELVLGQIPLRSSKSFSIETYFNQLQNLPREEAAEIFDKITESNPELAKKLAGVVKERELGITVKDKDLKAKGVASGDRAIAVKKELDKLKTKEEKATLWDDYVRKGIITKEVARQLKTLLSQ